VDHQHLQPDHCQQGGPQLAVAEELGVEGAAVLGAGVEDVEELEQHEGGEGQGAGEQRAARARPQA
jgi:hypothetical protein